MDMSDFQRDARESFADKTPENLSLGFQPSKMLIGKSDTSRGFLVFLHSQFERSRQLWRHDLPSVSKMSCSPALLPTHFHASAF